MNRPVTERDFRQPEFRDAKVEDYEWRDDGKLVRKDRWETGISSIRHDLLAAGLKHEFEIPMIRDTVLYVLRNCHMCRHCPSSSEPYCNHPERMSGLEHCPNGAWFEYDGSKHLALYEKKGV